MLNDNDLTEAFETFVDERLEDAGITRRTLLRRGVLAGAGLTASRLCSARSARRWPHPAGSRPVRRLRR
jgi:hypothetical protein